MGPLMIFISAGITTTIRHSPVIGGFLEHSAAGLFYEMFSILVPWLLTAIGFTFLYVYIPNTKVKLTAAFTGGLVAALMWKVLGFVFASFIAGSANYVAIYAAFATLIVLMIWIYASWLVVLVGANVSFYVQYPRYLRVSRQELVLTPNLILSIGLSALALVAKAHYGGDNIWTLDSLSKKLNVPVLALQQVMATLEEGKIIARTHSDPPGYFPACPFDTTSLEDTLNVLEQRGGKGWMNSHTFIPAAQAGEIAAAIYKARYDAITSKTLHEVLIAADKKPEAVVWQFK